MLGAVGSFEPAASDFREANEDTSPLSGAPPVCGPSLKIVAAQNFAQIR